MNIAAIRVFSRDITYFLLKRIKKITNVLWKHKWIQIRECTSKRITSFYVIIFNTYRNIHKIGRFNWGRYLCSLIWCSTGWTIVFLFFLYLIGVNFNQIIFNCLCMAILAILIILTILAIFLVVDFHNSLNLKRMDRVKVLVSMVNVTQVFI